MTPAPHPAPRRLVPTARLTAIVLAALTLAGALAGALAPAAEAATYSKAVRQKIAEQPPQYRDWLTEVELIITDSELEAFFALEKDYQKDAFIDRFWRIRDRFADTARNEYRERWKDRVNEARVRYGNLTEDRARVLLLNGPPDAEVVVRCTPLLYPTEIWFYDGSEQLRRQFFVIFAQIRGFRRFELWRTTDGLAALADPMGVDGRGLTLRRISLECRDGDKLTSAIAFANNDPIGFEQMLDAILRTPELEESEWTSTFASYSTDLDDDAPLLAAELELAYPARRQSRTVVQATLLVPAAEATIAELAGSRSYNFQVIGEVLSDGELFDSFRYKFDLPAGDAASEELPLVFERTLRPGEYRLVLKLEDLNGERFFRTERTLAVPAVEQAEPPPPPSDPETARILAEANAAIASGETTLKFLQPQRDLMTGYVRFETLTTGDQIAQVTFAMDGRPVLTKRTPPWSVDLDLGELPRTRTLSAVARNAAGDEVARDEIVVNAGGHAFRVHLVEPQRGKSYQSSLRARVEVEVPEGQAVERVELFLNETRVATLYQEPWVQPIVLPEGAPLTYVRAVAYLGDGNSTEDLVFVNAPEYLEEINVQFVELYTSVLDHEGRPVEGLGESDFTVYEDGVEQRVARFEKVRDLPIYAGILLDVSASMDESLDAARDAAIAFFDQIVEPKDRAAVITFNDRPFLAVKFTNDMAQLGGGLAGLQAERGTALYDSLIFALYYFNGVKGQRALLVLSDGKDESSKFSFDQALEYARRAGVTIYSVALRDDDAHKKLSKISAATGGRSYFIKDPAELTAIYESIERELRSQYLLAYQSSNATGSTDFRNVEVKVSRPGLTAKTIQGYYP